MAKTKTLPKGTSPTSKKTPPTTESLTPTESRDVTKKVTFAKPEAKKTKKKISMSTRSEITFPAGRTHRLLKQKVALDKARVGPGPGIFLAAVLEYLAAEVLELAGDQTKQLGCNRINERSIKLAVEADSELDQLFKTGKVSIMGGGATPTFGIIKRTPSSKSKKPSQKNKKTTEEEPKKKKKKVAKSDEGEPKKEKISKSPKKKRVQKDVHVGESV